MSDTKVLVGRITEYDGGYYKVECDIAPSYLKVHHLLPADVGTSKVGDRVELVYKATPNYSRWVVRANLGKPPVALIYIQHALVYTVVGVQNETSEELLDRVRRNIVVTLRGE